jgi:hypothetical protein
MSKRLILLFCALFVLAAAMPAFAAVQNIKVSGDILARYIARSDFSLAKDLVGTDDNINVFNTVTRVRIDADLTDNVSAVVRLINERNWGEADYASSSYGSSGSIDNTNDTNIQLDLAYVTLKEFLYSPLTLTIGRQELHFGNDMIIGDGVGEPKPNIVSGGIGTNQTTNYREATGLGGVNGDLSLRKSFDAIRATLNYDPLVIDLVYAKLRANVIYGKNNIIEGQKSSNDDADLYGINAGYKFSDKWNTLMEGYFWSKRSDATVYSTDSNGNAIGESWSKNKGDDVQVVGARVSTNPMKKLNLQQEFAFQFGERVDSSGFKRDRSAFASQSMAMLTPGWKYEPTMGIIYSYFSGEANWSSTKKYHAWDPMFENQTAGSIINALFPQTNAHNIDVMAKMSPMQDVWLQADYVVQVLARGLASPTGGVGYVEPPLNDYETAGGYDFSPHRQYLGQELDLNLTYNYTEDVQLGLLMGWFWPGTALAKIADDAGSLKQRSTAAEAIASCKVSF